MANMFCQHLVNGDARPNISCAFLQAHAREKYAVTARVVAGTISAGIGARMIQSAKYLYQLPALFQWLERGAQREFLFLLRPPCRRNRSVREENKGCPQGGAGCRGRK